MPDFVSKGRIGIIAIIADGMVLQRETKAPVWGWADPGTEVTATFKGQTHTAKAGKNGKWIITFKGLKASSTPATLEISSGKDKVFSMSSATYGSIPVNPIWLIR